MKLSLSISVYVMLGLFNCVSVLSLPKAKTMPRPKHILMRIFFFFFFSVENQQACFQLLIVEKWNVSCHINKQGRHSHQ